MKMLLVAAEDRFANVLGYHLTPLGFTLEHVDDPLRAIANLDDIDPQAILFSASDYPRHWKPLLKLAREQKSKEELIFILAIPADFEMEDAAKATHLGVNGLIGEELSDKGELYRLEEIIRRYRSVQDKRSFARLVPAEEDELGFAFTHPRRLALVTGKVREISIQGASLSPWRASAVEDLEAGTQIPRCSLKVGEKIVGLDCRLTRNREDLGLQFLSFGEGGHQALLEWIQTRSDRALKGRTAQTAAAAPA
jgi:DNA-binding response OmpR family regulator